MLIGAVLGLLLVSAQTNVQENSKVSPYEAVIKQTLESMESLTKTLKAIHDEDSAKGAKEELTKTAEKWQSIQKKAAELPPPGKEEKDRVAKLYKTKLEEAQKGLFGEVARVRSIV